MIKYFAVQRFNDGGVCATVQTSMARTSRHYYNVTKPSAIRLADLVTELDVRVYVTLNDDYVRIAAFTG